MSFQLPVASDADVLPQYKVQRYFLEPKLDEFDLLVVKDEDPSGELKFTVALRVVKPLDREERELYTMSLVAQDGGNPPKRGSLPIAVDIEDRNDNAPIFAKERYEKTLTEETPLDSIALTVSAPRRGQRRQRKSFLRLPRQCRLHR
ncbi:hypothetical protein BaRGS_00039473 [Batillaria attramentaria]|uniref:Cadherin domain-containing protein n=1 Tax=Batillaria attramentaria TaxID=370345 RepID=A0ABD0J2Y5_9CAEN